MNKFHFVTTILCDLKVKETVAEKKNWASVSSQRAGHFFSLRVDRYFFTLFASKAPSKLKDGLLIFPIETADMQIKRQEFPDARANVPDREAKPRVRTTPSL